MDPPSEQLVNRLTALGLCRPRDLRRCRSRVRQLARDLPTFETVWLDALVQQRRLTAFQAEILASPDPDTLVVGPFLLLERAGSDGWLAHYRARRRNGRSPLLLTCAGREPQSPLAAEDRLKECLARTATLRHPGLAPLQALQVDGGTISAVSPWTHGPSLHELLVRRGRCTPRVVAALARQLCDALATLERSGAVHGDLRLRNVRLTPRGQAILIVPGLRAALWPEVSLHADLPLDCCDGLAPELIGTGAPPNPTSDVYALGCMLWELLAGRPPFPHGDPLAKLAAHRTHAIPDVREWAPETPAALATLVAELTAKQPTERPENALQVAARFQPFSRQSRRIVAAWPADRSTAGINTARAERSAPAFRVAAAMLLLAAASAVLLHGGARTELLSIARRSPLLAAAPPPVAAERPADESPAADGTRRLPLPLPDNRGIIELTSAGPYSAAEVSFIGLLVIRGGEGIRPVILIEDRPLKVSAQRLILDNVELRRAEPTSGALPAPQPGTRSGGAPPLVQADVQELAMRRLRLESGPATGDPAVVWTLLDPEAATPRRGIFEQCVFAGGGVRIHGLPSHAQFDNVLIYGGGVLLDVVAQSASPRALSVAARHSTLRDGSGLIAVRPGPSGPWRSVLDLVLEECVLALGPAPLIELSAAAVPHDWPRLVRITGEGTLVPPDAVLVGVRTASGPLRPLPAERVTIDGLFAADIAFAGSDCHLPEASEVRWTSGYARSSRPPGIDASALPAARPASYNSGEGLRAPTVNSTRR